MKLFGSFRGRWIAVRNRLLASPRFQRMALRFPPTRPVARRHARDLFDLVAGFTYSQILAAGVQTGLFDLLARESLDTSAIAGRLGLTPAATETLLRAAAALRLVERIGAGWTLGSRGAALVGTQGVTAMIAHHALLYADLADPVALFRRAGTEVAHRGAVARLWPYAGRGGAGVGESDAVADYSALMAESQPLVAAQIAAAYPFARHRALLDIGGGEGGFVRTIAARFPTVSLGLFDLPPVVDRAEAALAAAGLGARVALHRGTAFADPVPRGYDAVTLVRVLHDHDDDAALRLLCRIRAALPPGGRLIVAEPMAGTRGAEPAGDAYFGVYLLAMGSGRPRHKAEIVAMLKAAGFARVVEHRTALPMTVRVIVATTSSSVHTG